jgi:hypothetical protein
VVRLIISGGARSTGTKPPSPSHGHNGSSLRVKTASERLNLILKLWPSSGVFVPKLEALLSLSQKRHPRQNAPAGWYRCKETIKSLSDWLKEKGLKTKPLHTLRKEFGSVVCDLHGIYAASLALGHTNIGFTARYYLDKKGRTTVGLGHLLTAASDSRVIQYQTQCRRGHPIITPAIIPYGGWYPSSGIPVRKGGEGVAVWGRMRGPPA